MRQLPPIEDHGLKIMTTSGMVDAKDLEAHNRQQREQSVERLRRQREAAAKQPKGSCPFSSALNPACNVACALFVDGECAVYRLAAKATSEDIESHTGTRCPFSPGRTCGQSCALHINGMCSITTLANQ